MKFEKAFITFISIDGVIFRKSDWTITANRVKPMRNKNNQLNVNNIIIFIWGLKLKASIWTRFFKAAIWVLFPNMTFLWSRIREM